MVNILVKDKQNSIDNLDFEHQIFSIFHSFYVRQILEVGQLVYR